MKISTSESLFADASGLVVLPLLKKDFKASSPLFKSVQSEFGFSLHATLQRMQFKPEAEKNVTIATPGHPRVHALLVYSWNNDSKDVYSAIQAYRFLGSTIASTAQCLSETGATLICTGLTIDDENGSALLEGLGLTEYTFEKYKKAGPTTTLQKLVLARNKNGISKTARVHAKATIAGTWLARDLVNTPAGDCRPRDLVSTARRIARGTPLTVRVYDRAQLKELGAGALLSVAAGSNEPPYLITISYKPKKKKVRKVAIVGKGVTFDSGGLSIKPAAGMMTMKMDMAGAATILGTMQAVAALQPDIAVTGYIPATENMISGKATRPGDVVTAMNGKTIEVLNTDAEGRLILADALSLASNDEHDVIIDLATLTGSVVVALGGEYAGLFSTSDSLAEKLRNAGAHAGERLWELPLAPEYEPDIISQIADIKNVGKGRDGGSITAALFLKHFVQAPEWAHLDIAGAAYRSSGSDFRPAGAVGFGVRTLVHYLLAQ